MKTFRRVPWLRLWPLGAGVAALAGYLVAAWQLKGFGFPLDDAWIHQTYARNLAELGQWAFTPGRPSAGSTSPLWALLLVPGYLLGMAPVAWIALLGWATLCGTAWLGAAWLSAEGTPRGLIWAGLLLALFEWHLDWAALSGMETLALGGLALGLLYAFDRWTDRAFLWGVVSGLGVWLRPDALTLALPMAWIVLFKDGVTRRAGGLLIRFGIGVVLVFGPYLAFNHALSGAWWPNTFYAKQAEYAVLTGAPLVLRLGSELGLPWIGPAAILLPGLALWAAKEARNRAWAKFAPLVWGVAYLTAYAVRLPVTYQHGRYAMPTIPVFLTLGLMGMLGWLNLRSQIPWRRVLSRAWLASAFAGAGLFWVLGAHAYASDVAIINTEMVQTAQWVHANTPSNALIAAHDIGAMGYFGDRKILDLAGLVSPEVIPFIRDEKALATYMTRQGAAYLVTFPSWYPGLTSEATILHCTHGLFSLQAGGENMCVYRWP